MGPSVLGRAPDFRAVRHLKTDKPPAHADQAHRAAFLLQPLAQKQQSGFKIVLEIRQPKLGCQPDLAVLKLGAAFDQISFKQIDQQPPGHARIT